jgi:hypothetical protein
LPHFLFSLSDVNRLTHGIYFPIITVKDIPSDNIYAV